MTLAEVLASAAREREHELWRTAVHEAGHALVGAALGLGYPDAIRIGAHGGSTWGRPARSFATDRPLHIVALLGGYVAERLAGVPEPDARAASVNDLARAQRLAGSLIGPSAAGAYLAEAAKDAERVIRRHWAAINRLAGLLADVGRLEGDDVRAALDWALSDRPRPRRWWRPDAGLR